MEMSFLDTLSVVTLGIGESEQPLLEERATSQSALSTYGVSIEGFKHTPAHSKRQRQCSETRVYRRHRRFHPHPTGKYGSEHGRVGSLLETISAGLGLWSPRNDYTYDSKHHRRRCSPLSLQLIG
jgi:hypothetical protein